jgi:hypothetical protein
MEQTKYDDNVQNKRTSATVLSDNKTDIQLSITSISLPPV